MSAMLYNIHIQMHTSFPSLFTLFTKICQVVADSIYFDKLVDVSTHACRGKFESNGCGSLNGLLHLK